MDAQRAARVPGAPPLVLTGFANADCNPHAPNANIVMEDDIRGIECAAAIYAEFAGEWSVSDGESGSLSAPDGCSAR